MATTGHANVRRVRHGTAGPPAPKPTPKPTSEPAPEPKPAPKPAPKPKSLTPSLTRYAPGAHVAYSEQARREVGA